MCFTYIYFVLYMCVYVYTYYIYVYKHTFFFLGGVELGRGRGMYFPSPALKCKRKKIILTLSAPIPRLFRDSPLDHSGRVLVGPRPHGVNGTSLLVHVSCLHTWKFSPFSFLYSIRFGMNFHGTHSMRKMNIFMCKSH